MPPDPPKSMLFTTSLPTQISPPPKLHNKFPRKNTVYRLSDYSRKTEIIISNRRPTHKLTYLSLAKSVSAQVKHSQCPQLGCAAASFSSRAHFGHLYFSRSFFSKMAGSTLWPGMPVSVSQVDQSDLLVGLLKCVLGLPRPQACEGTQHVIFMTLIYPPVTSCARPNKTPVLYMDHDEAIPRTLIKSENKKL